MFFANGIGFAGKVGRVAAGLVASAIALAPTAQADPAPGSGEAFFVDYMTSVFTPRATDAQARALIPLALLVCEAKNRGESNEQAVNLVLAGNGVETLGLSTGSSDQDQGTAVKIFNASTLAYCPEFDTGGAPIAPGAIT
jgi:hypothetical protein